MTQPPKSASVDGANEARTVISDCETQMQQMTATVNQAYQEIQWQGAAASAMKSAIDDWTTKTNQIHTLLDNFVDGLNKTGAAQSSTEGGNQTTAAGAAPN